MCGLQNEQRLRYMLIQGDCRKALPYIKSETVQTVITSPPYFGMVHYSNTQIEGEIGVRGTIEQYMKDLQAVFEQCYRILKPTGLLILNIDSSKREQGFSDFSAWDTIPTLRNMGFKLVGTVIWINRPNRPTYHAHLLDHVYEPIFILAKTSNYTFNKFDAPEGDVWTIKGSYFSDIKKEDKEPTDLWDASGFATFPVELITYLIALGSNEGDTVLDPFAGSGTVMDVCQRLKRNSIAIEINSIFCQKIMERCFNRSDAEYRYHTQGELERQAGEIHG